MTEETAVMEVRVVKEKGKYFVEWRTSSNGPWYRPPILIQAFLARILSFADRHNNESVIESKGEFYNAQWWERISDPKDSLENIAKDTRLAIRGPWKIDFAAELEGLIRQVDTNMDAGFGLPCTSLTDMREKYIKRYSGWGPNR